ncbi:hypothetical protein BpHYR1_001940 [Brachionus plicatilis]|uniref:Uncharacterized protein n=1 Tax=Brachionus plicatilis TaxID=10195 RepID=A0A3M7QXN1_BRAPC|nr:hypothetical protein BpHYR1_001940 [Brachionus plicatilis]
MIACSNKRNLFNLMNQNTILISITTDEIKFYFQFFGKKLSFCDPFESTNFYFVFNAYRKYNLKLTCTFPFLESFFSSTLPKGKLGKGNVEEELKKRKIRGKEIHKTENNNIMIVIIATIVVFGERLLRKFHAFWICFNCGLEIFLKFFLRKFSIFEDINIDDKINYKNENLNEN